MCLKLFLKETSLYQNWKGTFQWETPSISASRLQHVTYDVPRASQTEVA